MCWFYSVRFILPLSLFRPALFLSLVLTIGVSALVLFAPMFFVFLIVPFVVPFVPVVSVLFPFLASVGLFLCPTDFIIAGTSDPPLFFAG